MLQAPVRLYCRNSALAELEAISAVIASKFELHAVPDGLKTAEIDLVRPCLWLDHDGLGLLTPERTNPFRLNVDRFRQRLTASTDLVRACGLAGRHNSPVRILDVFAGFCIDALTLDSAGAEVTAVESNGLIFSLAKDFIHRLDAGVVLQQGDGQLVLAAPSLEWDVVYLDPMFAPRSKAALPGLAAQVLREIAEPERMSEDRALGYIDNALQTARRVVFKRPAKDPVLGVPNHQIKGRSVRFDVYL